jgi:hypothetical protein
MTSSLLARGLLAGLALSFLVAPAAFADDPGTTTTETTATTTTEATTNQPTTTETAPAPDPWAETPRTRRLLAKAFHHRAIARRWRAVMARPRPYLLPRATPFPSLLAKREWLRRKWRAKAGRARRAGHHPPHLAAWRCIHRWEAGWHDPNAPYYGGLQMDLGFQRLYGPRLLRRKGTADHWTRFEQMWVAERALRDGRGFYPWPVSASRCGLI